MRKSNLNYLDFSVNRFVMKLFQTSDVSIVKSYQSYFSFNVHVLKNCAEKFDIKY